MLKQALVHAYEQYWKEAGEMSPTPQAAATSGEMHAMPGFLASLHPTTEFQRRILGRSFDALTSLDEARLLLSMQVAGAVSSPFVVILVSREAIVFFGYGVIGRLNLAVAVSLAAGAFAIASAVLLILQFGQPLSGIARISPTPLLQAIDAVGR